MEWHQSSSPSTATARPAEAEAAAAGERKARPQKEQAPNCPRCNSADTKFCYYNNYSLSQPRYFCKTCRRYWTEGGSLRNVPVGGGSRKNKRPSSSSSPAPATATATSGTSTIVPPSPKKLLLHGVGSDFIPSGRVPPISLSAPRTTHKLMPDGVQDLNLGFPYLAVDPLPDLGATSSSAMGLLRPFMPLQELYSSSAFGLMQELIRAPPLSFPADIASGGVRAASASFGEDLEMKNSATTRRLLFPLEDVKPLVVHDPTNSTASVAAVSASVSASASAAEFQMISGRSSQAGGPPGFWCDNIGDGSGTGDGW